ncbi:MAG: hypothetical protein HYY91_01805 [Candidatus Omnitrophica bacterium]|nr:hypothetical protein [Candidatus Omnitrophota bacterium]
MVEEREVAQQIQWTLEPLTQTKTQDGVEIVVTHATWQYLHEFFRNKEIFGSYAGLNPFFPEQMVFYVKIANHSGQKLRIDPAEFVMIDDRENQYQSQSPDYSTALAEAKAPVGTMTRGVLEDARPGYFGVGLPVGKIIGKPQQRYALLSMSTLQLGYLYHGVVYDGLVAFWSPHAGAKQVTLLLSNIKTDFDANDEPGKKLEFAFDFAATRVVTDLKKR